MNTTTQTQQQQAEQINTALKIQSILERDSTYYYNLKCENDLSLSIYKREEICGNVDLVNKVILFRTNYSDLYYHICYSDLSNLAKDIDFTFKKANRTKHEPNGSTKQLT